MLIRLATSARHMLERRHDALRRYAHVWELVTDTDIVSVYSRTDYRHAISDAAVLRRSGRIVDVRKRIAQPTTATTTTERRY